MNKRSIALCVVSILGSTPFLPSTGLAQQVATPTFLPDGNIYNLEQLVQISCATSGATINYTTNGIDPTSSDPVIASGSSLLIDHPLVLKAIAFKTGMTPSAIKTANYEIVGKLAAGQNHSLAVKTDGSLLSWGKNANGQLGYGSTSSGAFSIPFGVKKNATTFFTGVVSAAGGAAHSAAVKTDGTVWAWGLNASGQVGDGTLTQRLYPVQSKLSSGSVLTGFKDIACGANHTIALKSDGTAWAWGLNSSGQVGNGTTTTPQKFAVQVKTNSTTFLTGVMAIAAGDTHSLALKTDGTVWAWGLNASEQLGNGTTSNQSYAVQVKLVGGAALPGIIDIACGANHSLALKSDGSLWAWGSNANGQLADGTTAPTSSSKQINAVQVMASASTFLSSVAAIAGGNSHTLALKADGTLWSWGLNASGQLGDGTATQQVFPVQVKDVSGNLFTGVVDLFAGASHSLASKADGTIWGWGLNSSGQAGFSPSSFNPPTATDIKNGSRDVLIIWGLEDPDLDTLLNWQERAVGTNTNLADTDGDGMRDDYEVLHSLNPLVDDATADPDIDGLTNIQEYAAGTDPHLDDTDVDLTKDGEDIYPLDSHFALKKTPEAVYAVVELVNDVGLGQVKMNILDSVIYSKITAYGDGRDINKSWVVKPGVPGSTPVPTYLYALTEPSPAPDPATQFSKDRYYMAALDINNSDQIVGYSSYEYPADYPGYQQSQAVNRLQHAVMGTGKFKDLGDGCIDNGYNDITGDPTIDGTNKGQSSATAISNSGAIVGSADFYVDVTPPQNQGDESIVASSAGNAALVSSGVLTRLGDLVGDTFAFALTNDKYAAGGQYVYSPQFTKAPFIWHENIRTGGDGELLLLPTPYNTQQSEVFGMNKNGLMVGYAYSYDADYTALLWQNGQAFDMTYQLNAAGVAAGWTIGRLWDINDNGVIVASGYRAGFGGLVLLLPDPAIQLVTPSGDPINAPIDTAVDGQNEFTFDASNPGVLNVHLKPRCWRRAPPVRWFPAAVSPSIRSATRPWLGGQIIREDNPSTRPEITWKLM